MIRMKVGGLFLAVLLVGCASSPTYEESLASRPMPQNQDSMQAECGWIRSEIARMESVSAASVGSQFALAFQAKARKNVAALEARASNIGCSAAFSSVISPKLESSSPIQQCIDACISNTNRSTEVCFDQCNK